MRETLSADPDLTAEYLRLVLEESESPQELLIGLRRVAEAQGMARVAAAAGLSRESLYRSLSKDGNPRLSTLVAVLRVAGLKLSVRPAAQTHSAGTRSQRRQRTPADSSSPRHSADRWPYSFPPSHTSACTRSACP